ncbi:MAG TPA: PQQ-binding-like beta-propeller repeat protein, partial [Humisphaera sp.]
KPAKIVLLDNPSFAKAWTGRIQLERGERVTNSFVREDWLFVYTLRGSGADGVARLYGVKRKTGEIQIARPIDGGQYRTFPPVLLRDYVAVPTINSVELYSLATGAFWRSIDVREAIRAEVVGGGTSLFVPVDRPGGAAGLKKYDVLREATQIADWDLMTPRGGTVAAPAYYNDSVYLAPTTGEVYALVGLNREPLWPIAGNRFITQAPVAASLKADEGGVYVGTVAGKLFALGPTTGQVRWQYFATAPIEVTPVVTRDTVYLYDANKGWVAIDKFEPTDAKVPQFTRKERWAKTDIAQILGQDDKYTYVLNRSGKLVAIDAKTGALRFEAKRTGFYMFATNPIDGMVYHVDEDGRLLAIKEVFSPSVYGEEAKLDDAHGPEAVAVAVR